MKEQKWSPTRKFLNKGNSTIQFSSTEKKYAINWKFKVISLPSSPLKVVKCEIRGLGIEAEGYGDSFFLKEAMTISLAESWERLLMLAMSTQDQSKIDSSNGFAAGRTSEEARKKSREELLERQILLKAWESHCGWEKYKPHGIINKFLEAHLRYQKWSLSFYRIKTKDSGALLCCFGTHQDLGVIFDCSYSSESNLKKIERKLIRSMFRFSYRRKYLRATDDFELPETGAPKDHDDFYSIPKNLKALSFLKDINEKCVEIPLKHTEKIKSELVLPRTSLPAVAYSINKNWPKLKWGLQSIRGINKWPHPLA